MKLKKSNLKGHSANFLKFLEELRLSYGLISRIPEEIEFLPSLRVLDLQGNRITKIPESINKLSNLKYLNFETK